MTASTPACAKWLAGAIRRIEADYQRSADTHLIPLPLPASRRTASSSTSRTNRRTRPAASSTGWRARCFSTRCATAGSREGTTIVEASSGSTAVSEAYFARLLGLPFIAVMPSSTSPEKIAQIDVLRRPLPFRRARAARSTTRPARWRSASGGHYMDQFTYAERATDWRGNNNIAESMFQQMARERHPVPAWIVVGAGTGGTSATIGRYVRYRCHDTQVCVADPEGSVFAAYHRSGDATLTAPGSRIEGIGRPRVEPSFIPTLVDRMIEVPNVDSIAAMRVLSRLLGRKVGPSTGTNFIGMLALARRDARGRAAGLDPLAAVRCRRALPAELPRRRLGGAELRRLQRGAAAHRGALRAERMRRARRCRGAPCSLAALAMPAAWALPPRTLQFPRDFGSHPGAAHRVVVHHRPRAARARASSASRSPSSARASTRTQQMRSAFAARQLIFAHAAVTDLAGRKLWHDQRIARAGFGIASAAEARHRRAAARLVAGARRADGYDGPAAGRAASRWTCASRRPSRCCCKARTACRARGPEAEQASYYYSEPQLAAQGRLVLQGRALRVCRARAWLDHEWSEAYLHPDAVGLGLDRHEPRRRQRADGLPPAPRATARALWAGGALRTRGRRSCACFGADECASRPQRRWTSPRTRARLPDANGASHTPVGRLHRAARCSTTRSSTAAARPAASTGRA